VKRGDGARKGGGATGALGADPLLDDLTALSEL
jgi:hypothetical protein